MASECVSWRVNWSTTSKALGFVWLCRQVQLVLKVKKKKKNNKTLCFISWQWISGLRQGLPTNFMILIFHDLTPQMKPIDHFNIIYPVSHNHMYWECNSQMLTVLISNIMILVNIWLSSLFFTSRFWANTQPDNKGPDGREENCAEIHTDFNSINNWNDNACSSPLNFICEKMLQ